MGELRLLDCVNTYFSRVSSAAVKPVGIARLSGEIISHYKHMVLTILYKYQALGQSFLKHYPDIVTYLQNIYLSPY